jgi:hypothetical protein
MRLEPLGVWNQLYDNPKNPNNPNNPNNPINPNNPYNPNNPNNPKVFTECLLIMLFLESLGVGHQLSSQVFTYLWSIKTVVATKTTVASKASS